MFSVDELPTIFLFSNIGLKITKLKVIYAKELWLKNSEGQWRVRVF